MPYKLIDLGALLKDLQEDPPRPPAVDWEVTSSLAATCPPPMVALDPEYLEDNGLEVDQQYLLLVAFQAGMEQGLRVAANELEQAVRVGLYVPHDPPKPRLFAPWHGVQS